MKVSITEQNKSQVVIPSNLGLDSFILKTKLKKNIHQCLWGSQKLLWKFIPCCNLSYKIVRFNVVMKLWVITQFISKGFIKELFVYYFIYFLLFFLSWQIVTRKKYSRVSYFGGRGVRGQNTKSCPSVLFLLAVVYIELWGPMTLAWQQHLKKIFL